MPLVPTWCDFSYFGLPRVLKISRRAGATLLRALASLLVQHEFSKLRLGVADLVVASMYALLFVVTLIRSGSPGLLGFASS